MIIRESRSLRKGLTSSESNLVFPLWPERILLTNKMLCWKDVYLHLCGDDIEMLKLASGIRLCLGGKGLKQVSIRFERAVSIIYSRFLSQVTEIIVRSRTCSN